MCSPNSNLFLSVLLSIYCICVVSTLHAAATEDDFRNPMLVASLHQLDSIQYRSQQDANESTFSVATYRASSDIINHHTNTSGKTTQHTNDNQSQQSIYTSTLHTGDNHT